MAKEPRAQAGRGEYSPHKAAARTDSGGYITAGASGKARLKYSLGEYCQRTSIPEASIVRVSNAGRVFTPGRCERFPEEEGGAEGRHAQVAPSAHQAGGAGGEAHQAGGIQAGLLQGQGFLQDYLHDCQHDCLQE
jgi:hypothetical protein